MTMYGCMREFLHLQYKVPTPRYKTGFGRSKYSLQKLELYVDGFMSRHKDHTDRSPSFVSVNDLCAT